VASLSQGRTAAAQCGLFTHKSVPVIFEPPCTCVIRWTTPGSRKRITYQTEYVGIYMVIKVIVYKLD